MLILSASFGQNKASDIVDKLCGVWIEENFMNTFDSTRNICNSRLEFGKNNPLSLDKMNILGVAICQKKDNDQKLYGYFRLSPFMMNAIYRDDNDNIEYSFDIDKHTENLNTIRLNINKHTYLGEQKYTYHVLKIINDSTINIHRYVVKPAQVREISLNYRRISKNANKYDKDIIEAYCLSFFKGNYTLMDSNKRVLNDNLLIDSVGNLAGYPPFEKLKCGLDVDSPLCCFENYAYLYLMDSSYNHIKEFLWVYNKEENAFYLFEPIYENGPTPQKGKLMYIFVKK